MDGVSLSVRHGEVVGLVGESGSGKSQTAFSVLGLLPPEARREADGLFFAETDLRRLGGKAMSGLRGRRIAYVPQEPMSNLDPSFRIGSQLAEALRTIDEEFDSASGLSKSRFPNFSVEMETGTGKTYVYLAPRWNSTAATGCASSSSWCRRSPFARACSRP